MIDRLIHLVKRHSVINFWVTLFVQLYQNPGISSQSNQPLGARLSIRATKFCSVCLFKYDQVYWWLSMFDRLMHLVQRQSLIKFWLTLNVQFCQNPGRLSPSHQRLGVTSKRLKLTKMRKNCQPLHCQQPHFMALSNSGHPITDIHFSGFENVNKRQFIEALEWFENFDIYKKIPYNWEIHFVVVWE